MILLTIANGIIPYFAAQTTAGVLLLIPIIIIEAILLTKFLKEGFGKSVKFCTVANVVSTLAGICFIFIEIPIYSLSGSIILMLLLLIFVVAFIVSILLEYKVYRYFWNNISKRKLFKAVIIVNIITYIPLTILAVYAFRSNARAPEKACRISCISNLKVIGIAMMQYSMDSDYLPDKSGAEGLEQLRCNGYFSDYSDHRIYVCPTTRKPKVEDSRRLTEKDVDYIYKGGFKHKYKNIGNYYNETDYSKIPVVWDKPTNHENYGNVLFLDGHVKGFEGKDWMEQAGIKKTAATTEPNYSKDGKFHLNGLLYTGPITVYHVPGKKWTELNYKNGVPEGYLIEWDKKGNLIGERKIVPKSVEYQWKHYRRHLKVETVN